MSALWSIVAAADRSAAPAENAKELLLSWAQPVYIGIVAIVAVGFLLNRKYNLLLAFLVVALVVAIPVFAPNDFANFARSVAHKVAG